MAGIPGPGQFFNSSILMSLYQLARGDHQELVRLFRADYSVGQLQIWYRLLTDKGKIPGMSEQERESRTRAIAEILGLSLVDQPTVYIPILPTLPANDMATTQPLKTEANMPADQLKEPKEPVQMAFDQAVRLAEGIVVLLEDYCDRIDIAGSIRRGKPFVKDVEVVAQPKRFTVSGGLFGSGEQQVTPAFRRQVAMLGTVIKGKPDGRYMQIELPCKLKLDLFMPQPDDYYRMFAIRTGSAEYSAQVIAATWKKKGWCGTPDGLRRISDCVEKSGTWKCVNPKPELPPVWTDEKEFFEWLGVKYLDPKDRN